MAIYVGRVLAWSRPVSGRRQAEFGAATPTVGWRSSRAVQGRVLLRGSSDPGRLAAVKGSAAARACQKLCRGRGASFQREAGPMVLRPQPVKIATPCLSLSEPGRPDDRHGRWWPGPCSAGVPGAKAGHRPHLRHEGHAEGAALLQAPGAAAGHRRRSDAGLTPV